MTKHVSTCILSMLTFQPERCVLGGQGRWRGRFSPSCSIQSPDTVYTQISPNHNLARMLSADDNPLRDDPMALPTGKTGQALPEDKFSGRSNTATSIFTRLNNKYSDFKKSHPTITKALTYAGIAGTAVAVAQAGGAIPVPALQSTICSALTTPFAASEIGYTQSFAYTLGTIGKEVFGCKSAPEYFDRPKTTWESVVDLTKTACGGLANAIGSGVSTAVHAQTTDFAKAGLKRGMSAATSGWASQQGRNTTQG